MQGVLFNLTAWGGASRGRGLKLETAWMEGMFLGPMEDTRDATWRGAESWEA